MCRFYRGGVCVVHLQSGVYCFCVIFVHFRYTPCELCVWLHLMEVWFLLNVLRINVDRASVRNCCGYAHSNKLTF